MQTARIDPTFIWKDGITTLGTEVDIFKTAAMAKRDWALSTLKLFQSCLLQSARDQLPHFKVTLVSSKQLPRPSAIAERSLHFRLVFDIIHAGKTVPIVSDVTALGRGRETVVMHSFSVQIGPAVLGRDPARADPREPPRHGRHLAADPATDGPRTRPRAPLFSTQAPSGRRSNPCGRR